MQPANYKGKNCSRHRKQNSKNAQKWKSEKKSKKDNSRGKEGKWKSFLLVLAVERSSIR